MTLLEIFANIFNLVSVFLANRNNVHTWWIGIIGGVLYGVMFYQVKLYADVILQVFFILTNLYGWWAWLRGGAESEELPITRVGFGQLILFSTAAIILTIGHGFLLHSLTDASFPFVDSTVLVLSIIAQFLLMRRKLESWIFWIIVDMIAVPLYAAKDLYLTSAIYFLFLLNAVWGLLNWLKLWRSETLSEKVSA
jgi:nicotinamide mononucleotide transporter